MDGLTNWMQSHWELLVPRVRQGGLLLADNTLYYGEAASEQPEGNAAAINAFNTFVRNDPRVESVLVPIADGLTLARKK
jgi:caffeoyl-CoA O-methyltransferase